MMQRRVTDLWILSYLNSFRERGCGKLMLSGLDLGLRGLDCFGSMVLSLCRLLETDFKAEEDALRLTEIKGEASMTTESRSLELAGDIYLARSRVTLTRLSAIITISRFAGSRLTWWAVGQAHPRGSIILESVCMSVSVREIYAYESRASSTTSAFEHPLLLVSGGPRPAIQKLQPGQCLPACVAAMIRDLVFLIPIESSMARS